MIYRLPLVYLLSVSLGISAYAAENSVPTPSSPPTPPALESATADSLLKKLPQVPFLTVKDGAVLWQDGDHSFVVADLSKDDFPIIDSAIGHLTIERKLVSEKSKECLAALPGLIDQAKIANLKGDDLVLKEGILTGLHLRSLDNTTIVLNEGVLKKSDAQPVSRDEDKARLNDLTAQLIKAMVDTELDEIGRRAMEDVLHRINSDDGKIEFDEVYPSMARRVVRFGYLRQFFPKQTELVAATEAAVAQAERFLPGAHFEGANLSLAEVKDGFSRSAWILTTPKRSGFVQDHEEPLYYWAWPEAKPKIVVDLPIGTDPTSADANGLRPTSARLFVGSQQVAAWTGSSLSTNKDDWRKMFPNAKGRKGIDPNTASDFFPPHILITALNGDIVRLITAQGSLTPPLNGSTVEAEHFLTDCAKQLPDPAHLDLVGEYILQYVYDSPDSRFPYLIGNKNVKGDIHQTAYQTIATTTGGMFRGDCDDLSELYQTIAERQGRTAHVISLPQHAAMAFAEKQGDGNWHVFVLQTGPALEFVDAKLPAALEKAYRSFGDGDTFDANGLGLLLRFSGENTRGQWRLSYRIFSEPEYAKTMIDVQRDWQYQTYQRGIKKMKKLISDGDTDNANYRELSGLYSFTGQYSQAVEYHEEAIKRTDDAENKMNLAVELVQHLFDAKQAARAREVALDILDHQLPDLKNNTELKAKIEVTQMSFGIELASALCHGKAYDLALRTLKDTQIEVMAASIEQVGQWLASPRFNEKTWNNSPQLMQLRHQLTMHITVAIEILQGMGNDALIKNPDVQTLAHSVQDWLAQIAFHDVDEPEEVLMRYATAGRYYSSVLGEDRLQQLLDGVNLPTATNEDHGKRIGGLAQMQLDLPWIKLSSPFWAGRLLSLFEKEKTSLDRPLAARLYKQMNDSYVASKKLGIEHPAFDSQWHLCTLVNALINQDEKTLRERLHYVKVKDDKRLRDDTAQWLGDVARFLPLDWYPRVLAAWRDELNYKPKYFWIAWRAALNNAPQHALLVADMAAQEFKDDPSFAEERDFMKDLFAKPALQPSETPKVELNTPTPALEPSAP